MLLCKPLCRARKLLGSIVVDIGRGESGMILSNADRFFMVYLS